MKKDKDVVTPEQREAMRKAKLKRLKNQQRLLILGIAISIVAAIAYFCF